LTFNVASAAIAAKVARPYLVKRGGGAIVNFASISAKVAQTGRWLYPVSKAAIVQLTRNMAMLGRRVVRDGRRLRRGRRLFRDGPRAGRAGNSQARRMRR
jgi:NAD(P)-dependent dehydrogenase (short-subunit alcohol dehydrogenase family)